MEERLDKLFKEKLTQHKVNPSDHAWDQINHQLARKRRNVWAKRLAVAASFLVLISAASIAYFYIDRVNSNNPSITQSKTKEIPEIKTKAEDNIKTPSSQGSESLDRVADQSKLATISNENQTPETPIEKSASTAMQSESAQNEEKTQAVKDKEMILPVELHPKKEESKDFLADNISNENVEQIEKKQIGDSEKVSDSIEKTVTEKTYPKIRIVYKADENSDLVAGDNKTLIDKGINKITKFSDEHIITDQVKTKLRNTKDDLLALNFGKILNKSNKKIDN